MRYLAVSGGKDSTAMALLLHERGEEFEMVFSDTGAEIPETYFILPRLARYVGKPLTVVSNGTFYQRLFNRGFLLPSPSVRWCTRELKQEPQDAFFLSVAPEEVAVGIRADERHRAKGFKPRGKAEYAFTFPLIEASMGKQDVLALCRQHGLLSPAYEWRSNTSCFCCFFQTVWDWRHMVEKHPALYALAEDWEEQSATYARAKGYGDKYTYTWKQGRSLRGLREASGRQLRLWAEDDEPEEACTICRW